MERSESIDFVAFASCRRHPAGELALMHLSSSPDTPREVIAATSRQIIASLKEEAAARRKAEQAEALRTASAQSAQLNGNGHTPHIGARSVIIAPLLTVPVSETASV